MDERKESIFRKQSLDRISSPEELDRCLVVTRPGVWFVLIAVVLLLIGFFGWAALGSLDTELPLAVVASEGQTVCFVPSDKLPEVLERGEIEIGGGVFPLENVGYAEQYVTEETNINIRAVGSLAVGTKVTPLSVGTVLADGIYTGQVTVQSVKPISYILN